MRVFVTLLFASTVLSACGNQSDTQALNDKQKSSYISSCEQVMAKEPNSEPSSNSQFCKCTLENLQTTISAKSIDHLSYMLKSIANDEDIESWVTAHPEAYSAFDKAADTCSG